MSIIEKIKNGARFRHKDMGEPDNYAFDNKGGMYVSWNSCNYHSYYSNDFKPALEYLQLIPEEEELWVAVSKNHNTSDIFYDNTIALLTEAFAISHARAQFGDGNYTIYKITRTK